MAVVTANQRLSIERIIEMWRVDDEWWRERITRHYFRVTLANGSMRTMYHDVVADTWHDQQY